MVSKGLFIIAVALALTTAFVAGSESFGMRLEQHYLEIAIGVGVTAGVAVLVKIRHWIWYLAAYNEKQVTNDSQIMKLLDFQGLTLYDAYVIARGHGKLTGHAYFRISNVPYLLDDLDKEKKVFITGQFVRILSTLNFPFEMIPRIMPVPANVYLSQINKEIDNLKLTLSAEGSTASPKRQARLKYLEKVSNRLLEGEGVRDVSFIVHLMVQAKDEQSIVKELESNAKTLMSTLESGLNVRAERIRGIRIVEVLREFFPASMRVNPKRTSRMLAWDLAYLVPLAKPKLPPLEKLLTGIYLGRTTGDAIVCLDINRYANPHIAVLGKSGYGKSTTVKTLVSRMHDLWETPVLIIDYAGEYSPYVRSRNGTVIDMQTSSINPFELGPVTLTDRMRQLIDMFQRISDLTLQQRNALSHYIAKAYQSRGFRPDDPITWKNDPPNLQEIVTMMNEDASVQKSAKKWTLMALVERLQVLASGPLDVFGKTRFSINELSQGFVCIDLSRVTSVILKDIVAYTILQHIDSEMRLKGMSQKVVQVVVIDEAWKLSRDENSLPVTIVKEGRKYGYSLIVSTQDATADLAESILANAGTVIIHHTEHPKYTTFFESAYGLTSQEILRIKNAPIGEALVKIGDDPRPFFVRVEMEDLAPIPAVATVSPQKSQNLPYSAGISKISADQAKLAKPSEVLYPDNLSGNAKRLLEKIASAPAHITTEYYDMLGLNAFQGNNARSILENFGLIIGKDLPVITTGRTGRVLDLTDKGRRLLNMPEGDNRHGGVIHRSMIRMIAKKYEGRSVEIEKSLGNGKAADLVVDGRVAIEVETRDFTESNIRKNLDAGYERVVLVCANSTETVKFNSQVFNAFFSECNRILVVDFRTIMMKPEIVFGEKK